MSNELLDLLPRDELARARGFASAHKGQLWARSRGVLRALLGEYLGTDPRDLRFDTGTYGKPGLQDHRTGVNGTPPASRTSEAPGFNLSHSGRLALYAFAGSGAVGVDVEIARRPIDEVAVAARSLGSAQARLLARLTPTARAREFLRSWVRYEAEVKCRGTGIAAAEINARGAELSLFDLDMGQRAAGAVALELPPREFRCWDWRT
ncbi:MAG TPA: 4'-phosphopantetheinyl transferase superfamily protein [Solirubrobacteraceae bacterium]|jgi:4'-phosphopantetheinyl transferase|nr:4'-phosphopantetheinyl transferase superfamily protein [Solirubrobacteraceae bacterium]